MSVCNHDCDALDSHVFLKNSFIKAIGYFFCACVASSKNLEGFSFKFCDPSTWVSGLSSYFVFSQPLT